MKEKSKFMPQRTGYRVDWLRYTVPYDVGIAYAMPEGIITHERVFMQKGIHGYTRQHLTSEGYRVAWSPERPDMGIMVDISGSKLNEPDYTAYTISPDVLIHHLDSIGGKLTRIDYAIDLINQPRYTPTLFRRLIEADRMKFAGREFTPFDNFSRNGQAWERRSSTLYLGARRSDRFMRIYDKAAQQKIMGVSWTRLELEIKGKRAAAIGKSAATDKAGAYKRILANEVMSYLSPVGKAAKRLVDVLEGIVGERENFQRGRNVESWVQFWDKVVVPFTMKHKHELSEEKITAMLAILQTELKDRNAND